MKILNFGKNVGFTPTCFYTPRNEQEVLDILRKHRGQKIRCIGRLHSWSQVIECEQVCLDLRNLNHVQPGEDSETKFADVGAGCQIKQLLSELSTQRQWTLPSVGFITEQSIAGAISTGTHGSGRHSLSHYVQSVRIARYDANDEPVIVEVTQGDELRAARCSLGSLGVILSVRMQCRPSYQVEEHFQEYPDLADVFKAETQYPLQQFYLVPWRWSYFAQHRCESESSTSASLKLYHAYRFLVFDLAMHLLILFVVKVLHSRRILKSVFRWILPACVVRNWRVTGPSSSQLVMEHELFRHVELELFVTRRHLPAALDFLQQALCAASDRTFTMPTVFQSQLKQAGTDIAMDDLRGRYTHHYPICVRKILPDDTLISMASHAAIEPLVADERTTDTSGPAYSAAVDPWYSITLTNYHETSARQPFESLADMLTLSMAKLFDARPHWGKWNRLSVETLRSLYPALERFRKVCRQSDQAGRFRNGWLQKLLACDDPSRSNSNEYSEGEIRKVV